jgi:hypothetical protein
MGKKVVVVVTVLEKRTPALLGPTRPDLGFRGAHGERRGRKKGDTEGWRRMTTSTIHHHHQRPQLQPGPRR